jgi:hypothetical protein
MINTDPFIFLERQPFLAGWRVGWFEKKMLDLKNEEMCHA